ncbi:DUF697 domain-containing protein [bacterium]|nr:DUF697 domain-containing protein [bacterium]
MNAAETTMEAMDLPQIEPTGKLDEAHSIVRKNMYWAMGIGVIPIPIVDIFGVAGFQIKAIKELSDLYEIRFNRHLVKNILASLLGGLSTPFLAGGLFWSVTKIIPGLGSAAGVISTPIMAGAVTYALGKVFIQHFESGGTFLNFDPEAVRDYFNTQIKEGVEVAKEAKKDNETTSKKTSAKS